MRTRKLLAAVAIVAVAPLLIAGAVPGEKVSADGTSALGPVQFEIEAGPDGTLAGNFSADLSFNTGTTVFHAEGPPTCLTVEGKKAAFIYRLNSQPEPQAIYVSMEEGSDGKHHIGFAGPGPIADLPACPVGPAPLEFTGEMDVTDAG